MSKIEEQLQSQGQWRRHHRVRVPEILSSVDWLFLFFQMPLFSLPLHGLFSWLMIPVDLALVYDLSWPLTCSGRFNSYILLCSCPFLKETFPTASMSSNLLRHTFTATRNFPHRMAFTYFGMTAQLFSYYFTQCWIVWGLLHYLI